MADTFGYVFDADFSKFNANVKKAVNSLTELERKAKEAKNAFAGLGSGGIGGAGTHFQNITSHANNATKAVSNFRTGFSMGVGQFAMNAVTKFFAAVPQLAMRASHEVINFYKGTIHAAEEIEASRIKLLSQTRDPVETERLLTKARRFAIATPFETREVVGGFTMMKMMGMDVEKRMRTIADLAAKWRIDMADAASRVGRGLQGTIRPLMMLGITKESVYEQGKKMGFGEDFMKKTQTGFKIQDQEKYQEALWARIESTSKGGADMLAKTWTGAISSLKGMWWEFQADVGKGITDVLAPKLYGLVQAILAWKDAGNWDKLAKGMTDVFMEVFTAGEKLIPVVQGIWEAFGGFKGLQDMIKGGGDIFVEILRGAEDLVKKFKEAYEWWRKMQPGKAEGQEKFDSDYEKEKNDQKKQAMLQKRAAELEKKVRPETIADISAPSAVDAGFARMGLWAKAKFGLAEWEKEDAKNARELVDIWKELEDVSREVNNNVEQIEIEQKKLTKSSKDNLIVQAAKDRKPVFGNLTEEKEGVDNTLKEYTKLQEHVKTVYGEDSTLYTKWQQENKGKIDALKAYKLELDKISETEFGQRVADGADRIAKNMMDAAIETAKLDGSLNNLPESVNIKMNNNIEENRTALDEFVSGLKQIDGMTFTATIIQKYVEVYETKEKPGENVIGADAADKIARKTLADPSTWVKDRTDKGKDKGKKGSKKGDEGGKGPGGGSQQKTVNPADLLKQIEDAEKAFKKSQDLADEVWGFNLNMKYARETFEEVLEEDLSSGGDILKKVTDRFNEYWKIADNQYEDRIKILKERSDSSLEIINNWKASLKAKMGDTAFVEWSQLYKEITPGYIDPKTGKELSKEEIETKKNRFQELSRQGDMTGGDWEKGQKEAMDNLAIYQDVQKQMTDMEQQRYENSIELQKKYFQKVKEMSMKIAAETAENVRKMIEPMGTAIGELLSGDKDAFKKMWKSIANTMLDSAYGMLQAAFVMGKAATLANAAKGALGIGGPAGAIGAAVATEGVTLPLYIAGTIAYGAAKALIASLSEGGMVKGSGVPAMLHSGELVLTKDASSSLVNFLEGSRHPGIADTSGIESAIKGLNTMQAARNTNITLVVQPGSKSETERWVDEDLIPILKRREVI